MNYELLLFKYIALVGRAEGVDFTDESAPWLSSEESAELRRMSRMMGENKNPHSVRSQAREPQGQGCGHTTLTAMGKLVCTSSKDHEDHHTDGAHSWSVMADFPDYSIVTWIGADKTES